MFGIGTPELFVIAVLALVVLGPERLPGVLRTVGRTYRQLRELSDEVTRELQGQFEAGMRETDASSPAAIPWSGQSPLAGGAPQSALPLPTPASRPASGPPAVAGPWMLAVAAGEGMSEPEPAMLPAAAAPGRLAPIDGDLHGAFLWDAPGCTAASPEGHQPRWTDLVAGRIDAEDLMDRGTAVAAARSTAAG